MGQIVSAISSLNSLRFQVRQNLESVKKFSDKKAFEALEIQTTEELEKNIAPLIPALNEDESAKRLDAIMYRIMLSKASNDDKAYKRQSKQIQKIAALLEQKATIPDVMRAKTILAAVKTEEFWNEAGIVKINAIREELRGLMQYLKREIGTKEIDITDVVIFEREGERIKPDVALENYRERASRYVKENENNPVLLKLKHNLPLDNADYGALEEIFWHEVGSFDEYKKTLQDEAQNISLGKFVRSLTGLSKEAAQKAFSAFLDETLYSEEQIGLVKCIMDWVVCHGTMERQDLRDSDNLGGVFIGEVFEPTHIKMIVDIIEEINANAMPRVA